MTTVNIYIEFQGTVKTLPINPEELTESRLANNTTYDVVGLGEVTMQKTRKLSPTTISSFFPESDDPDEYVNFFNGVIEAQAPCRLVCDALGLNRQVTVDGFEYAIKAGEEGDRYYTIEFLEWRDYAPKLVTSATVEDDSEPVASLERTSDAPTVPTYYTVQSGDSLWKIAKAYTGNGNLWSDLYALNTDTIGANASLIYAGQQLTLPSDW